MRNDEFYIYYNDSEVLIGSYSNVPTMGGGGKINVNTGTGNTTMIGARNGAKYYNTREIDFLDKSNMVGFHVGDFLHGMNGSYVAAYYLIFDRK